MNTDPVVVRVDTLVDSDGEDFVNIVYEVNKGLRSYNKLEQELRKQILEEGKKKLEELEQTLNKKCVADITSILSLPDNSKVSSLTFHISPGFFKEMSTRFSISVINPSAGEYMGDHEFSVYYHKDEVLMSVWNSINFFNKNDKYKIQHSQNIYLVSQKLGQLEEYFNSIKKEIDEVNNKYLILLEEETLLNKLDNLLFYENLSLILRKKKFSIKRDGPFTIITSKGEFLEVVSVEFLDIIRGNKTNKYKCEVVKLGSEGKKVKITITPKELIRLLSGEGC